MPPKREKTLQNGDMSDCDRLEMKKRMERSVGRGRNTARLCAIEQNNVLEDDPFIGPISRLFLLFALCFFCYAYYSAEKQGVSEVVRQSGSQAVRVKLNCRALYVFPCISKHAEVSFSSFSFG